MTAYNFRNLKAKAEHKIWFHRQQHSDESTASNLRAEFGEMVQAGKTDTGAVSTPVEVHNLEKRVWKEGLHKMGKNMQKCKEGGRAVIA